MPTPLQVQSGTFDLDDLVLKETDAAARRGRGEGQSGRTGREGEEGGREATGRRREEGRARWRTDRDGSFQKDGKGGNPDPGASRPT